VKFGRFQADYITDRKWKVIKHQMRELSSCGNPKCWLSIGR
jgi:hypothetical protein